MLTSIIDYLVSSFAARPQEQDFTAIAVQPLAKYYDEMRVLTILEKKLERERQLPQQGQDQISWNNGSRRKTASICRLPFLGPLCIFPLELQSITLWLRRESSMLCL